MAKELDSTLVKNPDDEIGVYFQISCETSKIKAANQICWLLETYLTIMHGGAFLASQHPQGTESGRSM